MTTKLETIFNEWNVSVFVVIFYKLPILVYNNSFEAVLKFSKLRAYGKLFDKPQAKRYDVCL